MAFFGRPVVFWKLRGVGFFGLDWVATQKTGGGVHHFGPIEDSTTAASRPRSTSTPHAFPGGDTRACETLGTIINGSSAVGSATS